ncbi:MAG TPA: N-6 DNA methylase, partial [Gallicola sp.]|nr:N-6 DNA methylase [Gallicola sp.]
FTMNEDEPMEREVAIDPEMLGKVFENLLDDKDRKSKGAFYTPREIVHYMCQETLINHLVNKTGLPEIDIRDFILYGDLMRDEDTTVEVREGQRDMLISTEIFDLNTGVNRLQELDDILANVKVADLAVGSGAFPLGMLNEILKARETLSEYMSIGMNSFEKLSFYAYDRNPYYLKINTIKNCIFACGIEPSAVDIAKLRLWLSIVIDDNISEDSNNGRFETHTKPRQLPNLDCNIICGDSLIDEFKGIRLLNESELLNNVKEDSQKSMFQKGVDSLLNELIRLQDKLFFTKEHNEKEEIKNEIQKIYNRIILEQIQGNPEIIEEYYETMNESSKPFIIWQLYFPRVFKDNGGFDIVIGNPPYGALLGDDIKEYYREKYEEVQFKIDSYVLFIIKAYELANSDGCVSFIIPNTLLNNYFLATLRRNMVINKKITHLINFDNSVFDAVVHSLIIQVSNSKQETDNSVYMAWNLKERIEYLNQNIFLENEKYSFEFGTSKNGLISRIKKMDTQRLEEVLDLRQA